MMTGRAARPSSTITTEPSEAPTGCRSPFLVLAALPRVTSIVAARSRSGVLMPASKGHWTTIIELAATHPAAFGVVLLYALLWLALDRASFNWNAVATLAVWIMTLFHPARQPARNACAARQA